jgi:hypothetical protein
MIEKNAMTAMVTVAEKGIINVTDLMMTVEEIGITNAATSMMTVGMTE